MITTVKLSKSFGDVKALVDVDLHFEKGNVYGIIGVNGAGKTTLFRCLTGIIPHNGEITYSLSDMRTRMGFMPTEPYIMSFLTAREYLQLLCNARKVKMPDLKDYNIFDLPLDRYAASFSTGMKKKLALTGILLQKNEVYILDEPFNGVDIQSNLLITEIIHNLKSLGKTLIISSHILSTLTDVCDYFVVLKAGRVDCHVDREAFRDIETEMKKAEIGDKLSRIKLD